MTYNYTGTEEFYDGTKVNHHKTSSIKYARNMTSPERFALVDLVSGNVHFLARYKSLDEKNDDYVTQHYNLGGADYQKRSFTKVCLNWVHMIANADVINKKREELNKNAAIAYITGDTDITPPTPNNLERSAL